MVKIDIELDLVSAAVADFAASKFSKNENDLLVSFLADEVKQTSFCSEGETNHSSLVTRHSSLVAQQSGPSSLVAPQSGH